MNRPRRPVRRREILAGGLSLALAIVVVVLFAELLRHPEPEASVSPEAVGGDPRTPIECPPATVDPSSEPGVLSVSSNHLYDCPELFDGRLVRYRGEAVGFALRRRGGAWIQLNDDAYAGDLGPLPAHRDFRGGNAGVGVFAPRELVEQLDFLGGPAARGDIVEVTGRFHRVDPRGEVAVIHADQGRIIRAGEPFHDPVLPDRRIAAIMAALVAAGVIVHGRFTARQ